MTQKSTCPISFAVEAWNQAQEEYVCWRYAAQGVCRSRICEILTVTAQGRSIHFEELKSRITHQHQRFYWCKVYQNGILTKKKWKIRSPDVFRRKFLYQVPTTNARVDVHIIIVIILFYFLLPHPSGFLVFPPHKFIFGWISRQTILTLPISCNEACMYISYYKNQKFYQFSNIGVFFSLKMAIDNRNT